MVGRLTEHMHHPVEPLATGTQNIQPVAPVDIVQEDMFPAVTARGNVAKGAGELQAKRESRARS